MLASQKAFGVAPDELVTLVDAVGEVLDGRVLSRDELVAAVGELLGRADLEAQLRSGWGTVLKPVAWQGGLCHAASDGNRVSFARPDQWLPDWAGVPDPEEAARIVIPAYLPAYGPATPERFDAWLTRGVSRKGGLRSWVETLGDRLDTVEVDGEAAFLLAEDVDDVGGTSPTQTVRLLPSFDQYVLGAGTKAEEIIAPSRRSEVSRTAGWISPVVIAGGRVAGTWEVAGGKVQVRVFEEAGPIPRPSVGCRGGPVGEAALRRAAGASARARCRFSGIVVAARLRDGARRVPAADLPRGEQPAGRRLSRRGGGARGARSSRWRTARRSRR